MNNKWSKFGNRFTRHTGARELMDDLGIAINTKRNICMLGGGNPAHINEIENLFRDELRNLIDSDSEYRRMLGNYSMPAGEERFRTSLAELLHREYGLEVTARNIGLTAGSQSGFFLLFNLLAGKQSDGSSKKILLPLTPEYIGYSDVGLESGMLTALRSSIDFLPDQQFKYRLNISELTINDDVAAICVSRPTNPTGNVLTDDEIRELANLASVNEIPLIIDNAYGMPFPQIIFSKSKLFWDSNTILCMSLSKLGLPGIRTGIIVAREEIIDAVASMNSVLSLSVPSFGAVLLSNLVASGEILNISKAIIQPFYFERMKRALDSVHQAFHGLPYRVHKPEGALFLWLWFPDLPISSQELYSRLKSRDVFVLSGHHFFPGLEDEWPHQHECLRVTYAQEPELVHQGLLIIGEEVRKVYEQSA
ncbi:MAG: valine--pyruvate transaminase [Pseudomonadota bacterium]|nr:valine--pyruvate transaminase [Pseudomonadota bacterium]